MNYLLIHNRTATVKRCDAPKWAWKVMTAWRPVEETKLKQKLWLLAADVVYGLMSHIPVCCIAYFCYKGWQGVRDIATPCQGWDNHPHYVCCKIHQLLYHKGERKQVWSYLLIRRNNMGYTCPTCNEPAPEKNHYATCQNKKCPTYGIPVFCIDMSRMEDEGGIPQ